MLVAMDEDIKRTNGTGNPILKAEVRAIHFLVSISYGFAGTIDSTRRLNAMDKRCGIGGTKGFAWGLDQ